MGPMEKKILLLISLMVFSLFLLGCSDAEQAAMAESLDFSLPDDVPVYPGAVPTNGYEVGYLTTVTYHSSDDSVIVHDWYDVHVPAPWIKEISGIFERVYDHDNDDATPDITEIQRGQYFYQTADYNPNPNLDASGVPLRKGKQILYTIAEADEGGTTLVIGYLNYDQILDQ